MFALALAVAVELRLDRVQQSLVATYRHYQQYINGVPVLGAERVEREIAGKTEVLHDTHVEPPTSAASQIPAADLGGATHVYVMRNGALQLIEREPIVWHAAARVFDQNPVVTLNDPSLRDQNNSAAAVPDAAYSTVDVDLNGPYARIVDLEAPFTTHADPSGPLIFDRGRPEFEEVNAYYLVVKQQEYLQSLGYTGLTRRLVAYPIPIDAHAADGADNSYYIQGGTPGEGTLYFGDGGTDDAEDADLVVHEFAHAIEDWIAPGAFGGANTSESRAIGEGFGDYWAFSAKYATATASGRDSFCIADWDARCAGDDPSQNCGYPDGANCLRRVDSTKTMADYKRSGGSGTEHENGAIWSSALRQIFLAIGKRAADTIVIESHFGAPPNPTFAAMAAKMLDADRLLYGGANADAICTAMTERGILSVCERLPRGERTFFQSPQQGIAIPDNDQRGIESQLTIQDARDVRKVFVHVDIAHPARGDLRVILIAPDGTEVVLHESSADRTPDIHGTFGIDLTPDQPLGVLNGRPANGTWTLRVADVLPRDAGTLLSWSLVLQFVGDEPSDARPASQPGSLFIAPVGHAGGANGKTWRTDVRLMNRGTSPANVTAIFTPSGEDGTVRFGALKLSIAPDQVIALDDVVAEQFATVGFGQLEITGDTASVVANARTYTDASRGTYGQFTSARNSDSVAAGESPLVMTLARNDDNFRTNVGFAEITGNQVTVRERLYDAESAAVVSDSSYVLLPFSHLQNLIPVVSSAVVVQVDVIEGTGRVIAYGTVVDNRTADPIYVPAARPSPDLTTAVAPVISAAGAFGTHWTSDVWVTAPTIGNLFVNATTGERRTIAIDPAGPNAILRFTDIVGNLFGSPGAFGLLRVDLPRGALAFERIATPGDGGTFGQFVPFVSITDPTVLLNDFSRRTVMPVERSLAFRTNLGVANLGGLIARVRVVVHDSSGNVIGSRELAIVPLQVMQTPVEAIIGTQTLRSGWANVEVLEASRGLLFYGSVVDNSSGDAVHIPAQ